MTIDHDMTQEPICPWCGEELDDTGFIAACEVNCHSCGKRFTVEVHTAYSTERVEDDESAA